MSHSSFEQQQNKKMANCKSQQCRWGWCNWCLTFCMWWRREYFPSHIRYSGPERGLSCFLLHARDGQPLSSPISTLGLKARQSWQRLSFSLEKGSSILRKKLRLPALPAEQTVHADDSGDVKNSFTASFGKIPLLIQSYPRVLHPRSFANCHLAQLDFQVFNTLTRDSEYSPHI